MSLTFTEIGNRFPDAVVYWDRDVAPTLDWEPRFVERDGVLWAVQTWGNGTRFCPPLEPDRKPGCRCRVWEPMLKQWWTHAKWNRLLRWLRQHELCVQMVPLSEPTLRGSPDAIEWRMRAWLRPITHRTIIDPID